VRAAISFFRAKVGKIDKINKCWYKGAVETLTFVSGLVVVRITNVMVEVHVMFIIFYTSSLWMLIFSNFLEKINLYFIRECKIS